jgi:hypothetical protein
MTAITPAYQLRNVLRLDSLTCVVMGIALASASVYVSALTALPERLLFWVGISLLPIGLVIHAAATPRFHTRAAVGAVIVGNLLWVVGSALLVVSGWVEPNALGYAFISVQALVVAVFVWLEYAALGAQGNPTSSPSPDIARANSSIT